MIDIIIDVLMEPLKNKLMEILSTKADAHKLNAFIDDLNEWSKEFIKAHEESVISRSAFANTIKNFNVINNIVEYVQSPNGQLENQFIEEKVTMILNRVAEEENVTPLDRKCIKEFVQTLLSKVKTFYHTYVQVEMVETNYNISQIKEQIDVLSTDVKTLVKTTTNLPVAKKKYDIDMDKFIARKVAPFSDVQQGAFHLYFHQDKQETLFNVCCSKKTVILLGEAGCGKSIVLQQVAEEASKSIYYPLLYDLRNYTSQEISQIINDNYVNYTDEPLFLLFDAYDEIEEKNRFDFARKITEYKNKHPQTIILISTRSNFYSFADDDGDGSTFKDFHEYSLCPLTTEEIMTFVKNNSLSYELFEREIRKQQLSDMASSPFYLLELIELLKQYKTLPKKNEVMEEMIKRRFKSDAKKYVVTRGIENYKYEIMVNLKKVAFSMQCLHQIELSDLDYQRLVPDIHIRELLMFSGVFNKNSSEKWTFEHNNFREYLAASLLCELDFNTVKTILCNPDGSIKLSWVNVLSYYLLLNQDEQIIEWLDKTDMSMLVKIERSRIGEDERSKIFINLFESYTKRNMWITYSSNKVQELAAFSQSASVCEYLIKRIASPKHFREQYNAISILSEFTNLFNKEELIQKTLFDCVKSGNTRDMEKQQALETIGILHLHSKEITEYLLSSYDTEKSSYYYRYGVILYLSQNTDFENYIDIYLDEYGQYERNRGNYSSSIYWCVKEVLGKVRDYTTVCKVIGFFGSIRERSFKEDKIFSNIIKVSTEWYLKGKTEIFDVIYNSMLSAYKNYNNAFLYCCKEFLCNNQLLKQAFINIVDSYILEQDIQLIRLLMKLADASCYEALLDLYISDSAKYHDIFYTITLHMSQEENLYSKYIQALKQNGIEVSKRIWLDYEGERTKGKQIYFDSLFNKDKFISLTNELLATLGNKEMTIEQLSEAMSEQDFGYEANGIALDEIAWFLQRFKNRNIKVTELIDKLTREKFFGLSEIYSILKDTDDITIKDEQKDMIYQHCLKKIESFEPSTEMKEESNDLTFSWNLLYVVFFSSFFDFCYNDEIYLKMLFIPSFLFYKHEEQRNSDFPAYLKNHLTQEQIKEWLVENAHYDIVCRSTAETCIKYCENNNLDVVINLAESYCKNPEESEYTKHLSIMYLDKIKGYNYVYERFLTTEDEVLFKCIVDVTKKYNDSKLIEMIEIHNEKSDNGTKFLLELIVMQSKKGLQRYFEISNEKMTIVDYSDKDSLPQITDAIATVKSVDLLPELYQLQQLLFMPNFKDADSFGLYGSLKKAYCNIAKDNYESVKAYIDNALGKENLFEEEKCFCYSLLDDITIQRNSIMDFAWDIVSVKKFLDKLPT